MSAIGGKADIPPLRIVVGMPTLACGAGLDLLCLAEQPLKLGLVLPRAALVHALALQAAIKAQGRLNSTRVIWP